MSACCADGRPPRLPAYSSVGLRTGERQHAIIDQGVVNDHIGLGKAGERVERQQTRIAGSGAGKPDMPRLQNRKPAAQGCECVELVHADKALSQIVTAVRREIGDDNPDRTARFRGNHAPRARVRP